MELSEDPAVRRVVPKLINSMSRAVNLCESTLSFGKAEEPAPRLERTSLSRLIDDVIESEKLAAKDQDLKFELSIPERMEIRADPEQLHRVITNLVRNARQALMGRQGTVSIVAKDLQTEWTIEVCDNGPGLPQKAQAHLFEAFHGGARAGGVGLGLAIAAELMRGHGGALILDETGPQGTKFTLRLPKGLQVEALAAQ
jgi:signal transduction histidine kinase